MENNQILDLVRKKADAWLESKIDEASRKAIRNMLDHDENELIESFYKDLEFGTGGLRGIMGVGTNRMNIYTVGMATQGLCNYLLKQFTDLEEIRIVIAHDCRNNSRLFAEITGQICVANGIKAFLFEDLRPTPELSFAIRHLKCQSGVVVTASHNPKEYNGYKVYWEDGGQIINPHDVNIIKEVQGIRSIDEVKFDGDKSKIEIIGEEIDRIYIEKVKSLSLNPGTVREYGDMKIIYTPIHGTGVKMVPRALEAIGFKNVYNVPEQDVVNGNFPTVVSPNPEESAALNMALKRADEVGADLVMATDPDSDRVGIAIRDLNGELILVNGNQTAVLLTYYLLSQWDKSGKLTGKEFIVKTIVTTELIADIAVHYDVPCYNVLTGFKYIAEIIRKKEGKMKFIGGGEESYGFMVGDFCRDKDAVASCTMIAEAAAWARSKGKSLFELLNEIYYEFSYYQESLINVVRKGKSGSEEIQQIMADYRDEPPEMINDSEVVMIHDYLEQVTYDLENELEKDIDLPKSNVLQFLLKDGSKISVRPSGTEPKIKFYFSVKEPLDDIEDYDMVKLRLEERIRNIQEDMGLV